MSDLIDTTEMYLKVIFELDEEGIVPLRARIAERLHQSGPTVSQTVARMERDGLVLLEADRHLELTELGRQLATRVMRKHRLAERLLVDVIGLPWELVHNEACRWEHVISEAVERRLVGLLRDPTEDPYGNPIPGLDELGTAAQPKPAPTGMAPLDGRPAGSVVVNRIGEPLQTDEKLLAELDRAGVRPGATVTAGRTDDGYLIGTAGDEPIVLSDQDAGHLFVSAA
ncbi:MAG TPA: metal-dependent transcriptional regulator [Jiangellaceae bacterium]|nr:metal-dependent transcriptional regulator [Jiangellaceae bacterium]